jgi:hypothetical protein
MHHPKVLSWELQSPTRVTRVKRHSSSPEVDLVILGNHESQGYFPNHIAGDEQVSCRVELSVNNTKYLSLACCDLWMALISTRHEDGLMPVFFVENTSERRGLDLEGTWTAHKFQQRCMLS